MRATITYIMITFFTGVYVALSAQDDPVLFTIQDDPVTVSEFKYIYEKNNRDKALYDKESLDEYLDLYINFKLKVHRAKELGMHEKSSYKQELEGYRRQLADSYVIDREVTDQMVDQIYERNQQDIKVKHILVSLKRKAPKATIDAAMAKVDMIQKALDSGKTFEDVAKSLSDDKGSASIGGDIGYMTAAMPNGYVELEHAMYTTDKGQYSGPIRTDLGYHWVKVEDIRPARGKMEVRHILMRKKRNGRIVKDAKLAIDTLYSRLSRDPSEFDLMVKTVSQDDKTKNKKGSLGAIGIGQYEQIFEDAVFSLKKDGDISQPIETSIGYHIIKRIAKKNPESKEQIKAKVKGQLNSGERFDIQKKNVIQQIKEESNFSQNADLLQVFKDSLGNDLFEFNWAVPRFEDRTLFNFNNQIANLSSFGEYVKKNNKLRIRGKNQGIDMTIDDLYQNYIEDEAIGYVESQLETRYIEFKNLLREYEEGILLFEITKNEVWDKASKDTLGLRKYYENNQKKYIWEPRADISTYSLKTTLKHLIDDIRSYSVKHTPEELLERYNNTNKEIVMHEMVKVERSSEMARGVAFKEGTITKYTTDVNLKITQFKKVEKIYPARKKTLKESRGYVISDFQDQLEKDWIAGLRTKYEVDIKKKVLKSLVAK